METLEERYFELFKMFNRIVEKMDFVSVSKAEFFLLVQIHRQGKRSPQSVRWHRIWGCRRLLYPE